MSSRYVVILENASPCCLGQSNNSNSERCRKAVDEAAVKAMICCTKYFVLT